MKYSALLLLLVLAFAHAQELDDDAGKPVVFALSLCSSFY